MNFKIKNILPFVALCLCASCQTDINNRPQLQILQRETLLGAIIVLCVAVALALLVAAVIPFQGGRDRSYIKRRIWIIVIGLISSLGFWLYGELGPLQQITKAGLKNDFAATLLVGTGIIIVGYVVTVIVIALCFRSSKIGSILGKRRNN